MIRPLLTELLLFFIPFGIYVLYLVATKSAVFERSAWPPKTIATLAIASLVLVLGSFVYLAHFSGAPPGSTYVPARMEDGRLVPGETKK